MMPAPAPFNDPKVQGHYSEAPPPPLRLVRLSAASSRLLQPGPADRFPGEGPAQPSTKGSLRGTWVQRAESAKQVPSDGSAYPGSPPPWSPAPLLKRQHPQAWVTPPSEKCSVLFPGPAGKDQGHDSGCLGRMWQASVLQVAPPPASELPELCAPLLVCPPARP